MTLQKLIRYTNADALEATWTDEAGNVIRCHAYSNHPEQMAQLRADLGAEAAGHEALIAEVEATYVPQEPEPIPVPQQITRAQGKAALIVNGLWEPVLSFVASIPDPTDKALAEVALHDTLTWQRSSPFLNTAATALGMGNEALDALFVLAEGIEL